MTLITTLKSLIDKQTGIKEQGLKKNATLLAYLLSKSKNEQGGITRLLHERLQGGMKI
jgi:hypothetical protein